MSDEEITSPSAMPDQPKTKELPAVSAVEIALTELTREVRGARVDIGLVSNDLGILKERVGILENERTKLSGGVRGLSMTDAEQAAQLAQERLAREELAAKVDTLTTSQQLQTEILRRVDRFFDLCDRVRKHPLTKIVSTLLVLALGGYAATKGLGK